MQCPFCGTTLADDAASCNNCDWTRQGQLETAEGKASDAIAVLLSVVPGLGHIYKGHKLLGAILMIGTLFALFGCVVIATATALWGLLLLPIYWAGVMLHVYWLDDRTGPPPTVAG